MFQLHARKIFIPVLVLIYAVIVFRAVNITFEHGGDARSQIRGDSLTESLAYNGARYFYDHGFWATKFMPNYAYTGELADRKVKEFRTENVYTHFPSLPDVTLGLTAITLRSVDIRLLRILPILLSPLLILFMWKAINLMVNRREAIVSMLALLMANYFVAWADNVHKFLYEEIIKWSILYIFLRRFRIGPRKSDFYFLGGLYFLAACISFDAIIVSAVLCVGFSWVYRRKILSLETILPGAMTMFCLALHMWQNTLFFGTFEKAWADVVSIFQHRTLGVGATEMGRITLLDWLQHLFYWNINRVERYFALPGWLLLIYGIIVYRKWAQEKNVNTQLLVVLAIAAIAWNCVMWQHAMVHVSTARNWAMLSGLLTGPILLDVWDRLRNWKTLSPVGKTLLPIASVYFLGMFFSQHIWSIYLQYGFFYPRFGY